MIFFPHDPAAYVRGVERAWAVRALRSYYRDFSGGWFERLSDRAHPDVFTANDIVAVSTLAVDVPARTSIWLLQGRGRDAAGSLLSAIPGGVPIWHAGEELLGRDSPAQQLWDLLRTQADVGPVIAGKLMAAKRPQLIPIWDKWVDDILGPVDNFWLTMSRTFADSTLRADLTRVRDEADLPCTPSLLRTVDVVLWMRRYGYKDSSDPQVRGRPFVRPPVQAQARGEPVLPSVSREGFGASAMEFRFRVNKSFLARGEITLPVEFRRIFDDRLHGQGPSWPIPIRTGGDRTPGSIRRGHTGGNRYYQIRFPPQEARRLLGTMQVGDLLSVTIQLQPTVEVTVGRVR